MNIYKIFLYIGLLSFLSCTSNSHILNEKIPPSQSLISTQHLVEAELLIPSKIFLHQNKIIVFEQRTENMFKVFDFPSFQYLYSFGNRGRAGNEINSTIGNSNIINSEFIEIHDNDKLKYIHVTDTAAEIIKTKPLPLAYLKSPINRLNKICDSVYYFDNIFENNTNDEFVKVNIISNEQTLLGTYPNWINEKMSATEKYSKYLKSSVYNNFNNRIAAFYYHFPVLKIFNTKDGSLITETRINSSNSSLANIENSKKIYFTEPYLSDEYIYVMWIDKEKKAIDDNLRPNIFVFGWDGHLLANYQLDTPIVTFTISEKLKKIYCTSFYGENIIYEYELPEINNNKIPLTKVENSLYTVSILDGYTFSQVSKEDGIDKIVEKNDYKTNINYFTQVRDKDNKKKYDLESICIAIYEPLSDTIQPDINQPIDFIENNTSLKKEFKINNQDIKYTLSQNTYLDPKGKEQILYNAQYAFVQDGKYIILSISSNQDNCYQYHSNFKQIVQSFQLK